MFEIISIIAFFVFCLVALTIVYQRQPFKALPPVKPKFILFPKFLAKYDRPGEAVEKTLTELAFTLNPLTGLYTRGKVRNGLFSKSIKLTVSLNREKKEVAIYSSFACILYDDGEIWQLTHNIVNGINQENGMNQELVDMFKRNN